MFRKRKRIPYDPPGARKRKGNRRPPMRADQIFITRRMLLIKGAISAAFLTFAARLGYMQIVQGQTYEKQATDNIQKFEQIKAPRGMIFDRAGRVLAENYRAWEVRIVPGDLPTDKVELQRVKDTLITALRLPDVLTVNPNAVPIGSDTTVYSRVADLLQSPSPEDDIKYIKDEAKRNYLVLVEELTPDLAAIFRAESKELPGVEVLNYIDYLIGNSGDQRLPITVKRDVSKEIARKLEANSLYLPGVVLDDSALQRRYPGGDVMSHLLGYVGVIDKDEFEDPDNFTDGGQHIYSQDDIIGKDGLERTMESELRGKKGGHRIEIDSHGVAMRVIPGSETPAVNGKNIKLSIDLELQALISTALEDGLKFSNENRRLADERARADGKDVPVKEYNAASGAVVAIDPRNGEVLGMVSYPHYDNSLFLSGISRRKYREYLDESKHAPLINRASGSSFPPGSTIKPFIATSALRDKKIYEDTTFYCSSALVVPWTWDESKGNNYYCWVYGHTDPHGSLTVYDAIERSCDIFFYNAGTPDQTPEDAADKLHYFDLLPDGTRGEKHYFKGLGIVNIDKNLKNRFWFGEATGIDLPYENPGLVPNEQFVFENYNRGWSSGDTINVSIGQGFFQASPLQLALNTAAIANGGKIYRPLLVREFVDDKIERIKKIKVELKRDMKVNKKYLDIVREGMRRVVNNPTGTANQTQNPDTGQFVSKWLLTNPEGEDPITIAGKTGTAEFGEVDANGKYLNQHAWFTCYAPFEDPEIAVTVFLEGGGEGATYAVPVADRVLRAYFEIKKKRKRGLVLRKDKKPIGPETPAPKTDTGLAPGEAAPQGDD